MKDKQNILNQMIRCLSVDYGIEVASLDYLPIGADQNASVYKATAQNHDSYFVKFKQDMHDCSVVIAELLYEAGIEEIIPPIKTLQRQLTQRIQDGILIIYPFVEGEDGFSRDLCESQWIKLGQALKKIHEITLPTSIKKQIRCEHYSSKWREAVRSLYFHIETDQIGDDIALNLASFLKDNEMIIHRLVNRSEQLVKKVEERSPKFVLCHSDIHGGNVLLEGNKTIYIVDWDEPILAPKERDLMFIGGGVGNVWNKPVEEKLFYKGYGKVEVDLTILAYYRFERIVEDIAIYGQELLLEGQGQDREVMFEHFIAMFDSNGVVDIAFHTDEILQNS